MNLFGLKYLLTYLEFQVISYTILLNFCPFTDEVKTIMSAHKWTLRIHQIIFFVLKQYILKFPRSQQYLIFNICLHICIADRINIKYKNNSPIFI